MLLNLPRNKCIRSFPIVVDFPVKVNDEVIGFIIICPVNFIDEFLLDYTLRIYTDLKLSVSNY